MAYTMAPLYDDVARSAPTGIAGSTPRQGLPGVARTLIETLRIWHIRAAERRQLLDMDDHLLADIGLTRADAMAESAKPVWKA